MKRIALIAALSLTIGSHFNVLAQDSDTQSQSMDDSTASGHAPTPGVVEGQVPPADQLAAPQATSISDTAQDTTPAAGSNAGTTAPIPAAAGTKSKSGDAMTSSFVPDGNMSFAPTPQVVSGKPPEPGKWAAFVQQFLDINKPGYLGNLLSASQQTDIQEVDKTRETLDTRIANGAARGLFNDKLQDEFQTESKSIGALESQIIERRTLSYEEALDVLFRLNMLRASLDAAVHGRAKPIISDYFDNQDPVSYRDHLLRKLYYFRLNNHLSETDYDELRARINHIDEHLDEVGHQADTGTTLQRYQRIDAQISQLSDSSPTATTEQHFIKKF